MTAAQSLTIYDILNKHFKNASDAKQVVTEIEFVIDAKLEQKKEVLATKDDIRKVEEKLNDQFKWLVGTMVALVSLSLAIIKFL